jgi:F-type H+-transporting ATPase subunit delta
MAELTTLARPYARAAFETAVSKNDLLSWSAFLKSAAAVVQDKKVHLLLSSPQLPGSAKSALLLDLLGEAPGQFANFIATLADNKRLPLLAEIYELFTAHKSDYEKAIEVSITSAFPVAQDQLNKLNQALTDKLQRQVTLTSDVDQSLLGGAIIRAGDTVIDGSVKGQLTKLAETMNA